MSESYEDFVLRIDELDHLDMDQFDKVYQDWFIARKKHYFQKVEQDFEEQIEKLVAVGKTREEARSQVTISWLMTMQATMSLIDEIGEVEDVMIFGIEERPALSIVEDPEEG